MRCAFIGKFPPSRPLYEVEVYISLSSVHQVVSIMGMGGYATKGERGKRNRPFFHSRSGNQTCSLAGWLRTLSVQVEKIATPKPGKSLVFHLLRRRRRREIERKVGMQLRGSQKGKEERKGIFLLFCTLLLLSPFCGRVGARLAKVRQRREGPLKTPRSGQKRGRGNSPIAFKGKSICETAVSSRLE